MAKGRQFGDNFKITPFSETLEGKKLKAKFDSGHEDEFMAKVASDMLKGDMTRAPFDKKYFVPPTKEKLRYKLIGPFLTKLLRKHPFPEVAAFLGVGRMTLYRWRNQRKISVCHSAFIHKMMDAIERNEALPRRGLMKNEEALKALEIARLHVKSWEALAKRLNVTKKTIIRWRKTGKISQGFRDVIYFYCEDHPELKSFRKKTSNLYPLIPLWRDSHI
ncbi:MAG: helix-turn-helix domain-containing protein [Candidatus Omnitrophica bacterium]|nr:helix-turn-helix domain-containing protein [Candidatus Omnitrophota bacterium]